MGLPYGQEKIAKEQKQQAAAKAGERNEWGMQPANIRVDEVTFPCKLGRDLASHKKRSKRSPPLARHALAKPFPLNTNRLPLIYMVHNPRRLADAPPF